MKNLLNPMEDSWNRRLVEAFGCLSRDRKKTPGKESPYTPISVERRRRLAWEILEKLEARRWPLPPANGGFDLGEMPVVLLNRQLGLNVATLHFNECLFVSAIGLSDGAPGLDEASTWRIRTLHDDISVVVVDSLDPPLSAFEPDDYSLVVGESDGALHLTWSGRPPSIAIDQSLLRTAIDRFRLHEAALLLGLAEGGLVETIKRAKTRHLFGRPQIDHQAVGHQLAALAARCEMLWLGALTTARRIDLGNPATHESARILALSGEFAQHAVRTLIQLHGSLGLIDASMVSHRYRCVAEWRRKFQLSTVWREEGRCLLSEVGASSRAGAVQAGNVPGLAVSETQR